MPLEEYKRKRKFNSTPEPEGKVQSSADELLFVVQKHHASHLHFDFRLELKGVLKSWAVPKGPSMHAGETHLAMLVEDHPYSYRSFEGIIPKGNYGAGTVMVWDTGTYEPVGKFKNKKEREHELSRQFWSGKMNIVLHGKKLKGAFELTRIKERGENAWLLKKTKDKFALKGEIKNSDRSALTSRTLEQIARDKKSDQWQSNRKSTVKPKVENKPVTHGRKPKTIAIKGAVKKKYPANVHPMLATVSKEVFDDKDWLYEVKWDGYRILAHKSENKCKLYTRNGLDYTSKYELVANDLCSLPHDCILDGEIVVLNDKGQPDYDALQKYNGEDELVYYVFDVLWLDGYSLMNLPLVKRREILWEIVPDIDTIRVSQDFESGTDLLEEIKIYNLEGIVAKRRNSIYEEGKRSNDWRKITTAIRNEYVIGGWTESGSGRKFRSLLFGEYRNNKLYCVGHAGGGYKEKEMGEILGKLKKLETGKSPFVNEVEAETKVHWIKPGLVGEFKFATFTKGGKVRKPAIFLGFRPDKNPHEIIAGTQQPPASEIKKPKAESVPRKEIKEDVSGSNWPKIIKPHSKDEFLTVEGEKIQLTEIDKELWKNVTKAELIRYYITIAPYILPYLKDRPLSLHIKQDGPFKQGFYIKDMEGHQPDFAKIFQVRRKHKKEGKRNVIDYLVCNNLPTLVYLINLGCIDVNPWNSRTVSPENPDYIVIDLDPSDDDFKKVIEVGLAAKELFAENKLITFAKTSGKTGIHLLIPCSKFDYTQARTIAENICSSIHSMVKDISTTEVTVSKRNDRVYIDPNQNDSADTIASAYSVRPHHLPTVSTPIEWKELNHSLDPHNFTIHSIEKRLKTKKDLFRKLFSESARSTNDLKLKKFL
jgi:bifunctional non-homologous end joining protein LigD